MLDKHKPFACETCFWLNNQGWRGGHKTENYGYCQIKHKEVWKDVDVDFCGEHQDGPPSVERQVVNTLTNISTGEVHTMPGPVVTTKPTPTDKDEFDLDCLDPSTCTAYTKLEGPICECVKQDGSCKFRSKMNTCKKHKRGTVLCGMIAFCGNPNHYVTPYCPHRTPKNHCHKAPVRKPDKPKLHDDDWNVMKQCPDERTDGFCCENLKLDENHRNFCHHHTIPLPDKMPDNLPLCFFCKTGDEA